MDIQDVKAALPVTFVLHAAGHRPEAYHGNDILYRVPWRHDSDPSLACYSTDGNIVDRWRDMARGDGGDVLDLIQRLDPQRTVPEALWLAEQMLASPKFESFAPPQPMMRRKQLDLDAYAEDRKRQQLDHDSHRFDDWALQREDNLSTPGTGDRLHSLFGIIAGPEQIEIPYFDHDLSIVGAKRRPYDGHVLSLPGNTCDTLYGIHLDKGPTKPVVLCEGESDVWSGTLTAGQDYVFLGLPSGAGYSSKVGLPASRRVLIALDGDEAGRSNIVAWADALINAGNTVEVVPLPEGGDLSSYPDIDQLLAQARPFLPRMRGIIEVGGQYRRTTKDGDPGMELSDFVMTPERVMVAEDGALSYEVRVANRTLLVTDEDLATGNSLSAWARRHGLGWSGGNNDVVVLRNNLACDSMTTPTELASSQAGLFSGHIVWEGGSIGPSPARYVPRGISAPLDIRLSPGRWDVEEFEAMLALGPSSYIHPILAWAAVAPARSLVRQFPTLLVTGASGAGKTTFLQHIIPRLTGSHVMSTLTSTTPFGVEAIVSSSSGFPVVFDEYRPGARTPSLQRLEQLVRDAYDGTPSFKSQGGDNWSNVVTVRTSAPIVLSGEQTIEEISHAERMVIVHLTKPDARTPEEHDALRTLERLTPGHLAHDYLSWLVSEGIPRNDFTIEPAGPDHLPTRARYNIGVLAKGWDLLDQWLDRHRLFGVLPDADWGGHTHDVSSAVSSNPVLDAVRYAAQDSRCELVWEDADAWFVQPTALLKHTRDLFVLPGGNARTIREFLKRQHGAYDTKAVPPSAFDGGRKDVLRVEKMVD